jgi:hypothetical protein
MCFSRGDRHDSMRFDLKSGLTNQREMLKGKYGRNPCHSGFTICSEVLAYRMLHSF